MSRYYDSRQCHPLILYQEGEYQVHRDKHGIVRIKRKRIVEAGNGFTSETFVWWHNLTRLNGYWSVYLFSGSRTEKLAVNRKYAKRGKVWIERWKMLLAGELWTARCDDWDGQDTACPLQRDGTDGAPSCPIRFFFMGYSGGRLRELPGICDGPLNDVSANVCLPIRKDKHGFSMSHLHKIRREIWARGNKEKGKNHGDVRANRKENSVQS